MYDRKILKNTSGYIERIGNKKERVGKNTTVGEAWKNCEPIVRGIISEGGGKKSRIGEEGEGGYRGWLCTQATDIRFY